MTSSAPRHNVRLRMACDGCSGAKVKCDKKHPSCDRCVNNHLTCAYGVSRRHGKQSWQKKLASEREKALGTAPRSSDVASSGPIPLSGGPNATSASLLAGQAWSYSTYSEITQDPLTQSFDQHQDLFRFDDFLEPMQFWPQVELPLSFALQDLGTPALQNGLDGQTPFSPTLPIPQQNYHEPQNFAPVSTETITGPARHSSRSRYQQALTNKIHDCEARAIAVLRSLHHHYTRPLNNNQRESSPHELMTSIGSSAHEKPPVSIPHTVPTFDQVLFANKLALSGWSELMGCSCTRCPHLGFLYVSIISKVLFWYRVVAARMFPLPEHGPTDNNDAQPQQRDTLDVPPEFKIRLPPIQIGILELDQEDQANLRRVMLLRELRRVDKAVAEMANMKHVTENDPATYHAAQWLQLGISRVREQLQEVIQHIEDGSQD